MIGKNVGIDALSQRVTDVNEAQRKFNAAVIDRGSAQADFNQMVLDRLKALESEIEHPF